MGKEEIKIAAVGDISFGDHYLCCGFGVRSEMIKFGADIVFNHVSAILRNNEIVFGNLEGILSLINFNKNSLISRQMRGLPESATAMKNAGFTVVSLANNHIMQHGRKALIETIKLLETNGIGYCGIEVENNDSDGAFLTQNKGISICFLSYNDRPDKYLLDSPIYKRFKIDEVLKSVAFYRQRVDLIIISIHWGDEYIQIPSSEQQLAAHNLIDNGADVILGHHPHVIQGVERYKNGLIFYSLGNFVFDMPWYHEANRSFIAKISFNKLQNKLSYEIVPVKIKSDYQPEPISNYEGPDFLGHIKTLSNTIIENRNNFTPDGYRKYYLKKLNDVAKQERKLSHRFWVRNLLRYPVLLLPQYVYEILIRRFHCLLNKINTGRQL